MKHEATEQLKTLLNSFASKRPDTTAFKTEAMRLIKEGADPNTRGQKDTTLLSCLILTNKDGSNDGDIKELAPQCPTLVHAADQTAPVRVLMDAFDRKEISIEHFRQNLLVLAELGANLKLMSQTTSKTPVQYLLANNDKQVNNETMVELFKKDTKLVNAPHLYGMTLLQGLIQDMVDGRITLAYLRDNALFLASQGADLTVKDNNGNTLLHHLVLKNKDNINTAAIKELKTVVNAHGRYEYTPLQALMYAYNNGQCNLDYLRVNALILVELGADLTVKDNQDTTLLHHLILTNNEGVNTAAITQLKTVVNVHGRYDYTPLQALMYAYNNGQCKLDYLRVNALILADLGADLTVKDNQDNALLHHLVLTNNEGVNTAAIKKLHSYNDKITDAHGRYRYTALQALMYKYNNGQCTMEYVRENALILAELGADLTVKDNRDDTLLHHLILKNNEGVNTAAIKQLHTHNNTIVDAQGRYGYNPLQALMYAYNNGQCNLEFLRINALLLAELGADLTVKDNRDDTLLHHLVLNNQDGAYTETMTKLCEQNTQLTMVVGRYGNTPLQALMNKYPQDFNIEQLVTNALFLLEHGADASVKDNKGNTILHHLVLANKDGKLDEVIDKLVKETAELVHLKNNKGETPLQYCLTNIKDASIAQVEKLIALGSDINTHDNANQTLLHVSCSNGNLELAKYFAGKGLDIKAKTNTNQTALHLSIMNGHPDLWNWLLENGVDINAQTNVEFEALNTPAWAMRRLLQVFVSHNVQTNSGYTALCGAVFHQNIPMVRWLLEHKANPNLDDFARGQISLVHGVQVRSLVDLARVLHHQELAQLLIDAGGLDYAAIRSQEAAAAARAAVEARAAELEVRRLADLEAAKTAPSVVTPGQQPLPGTVSPRIDDGKVVQAKPKSFAAIKAEENTAYRAAFKNLQVLERTNHAHVRQKVGELLNQVDQLRSEGKLHTVLLTNILRDTHQFLTGNMDKVDYHRKAQALQEKPNTGLKILGGIMIALAVIVVALGIAFFPALAAATGLAVTAATAVVGTTIGVAGAGLTAASIGLFAHASPRKGISTGMNEVEKTLAEYPQEIYSSPTLSA